MDKYVLIKLGGSNIKHYKNLGYELPFHFDKKGRKVYSGETINVNIYDIPSKTDGVRFNVICDYCGVLYNPSVFNHYKGHKKINKDACRACTGKKNNELNLIEYGTTSRKEISKIKNFKIGRKCLNGELVYNLLVDKGYSPMFCQDDYVNCKQALPYLCNRHKDNGILYITADRLIYKNHGCKYCAYEKRKGSGSPSWKGGITSENEMIRKSVEYANWRKSVFERDSYICQCCRDNCGNNLNAHHLFNFSEYPELRLDVDNGITLCERCHSFEYSNSFHGVYGTKSNIPEQFYEYVERFKSGEFCRNVLKNKTEL